MPTDDRFAGDRRRAPCRADDPRAASLPRGRMPAAAMVSLAVAGALPLAGCSDPKAATKANFKKALTAAFDKVCPLLEVSGFPAKLSETPFPDYALPTYEALAAAHLLSSKEEIAPRTSFARPPTYLVFTLTEQGRKLFKPPGSLGPDSAAGFCAGTYQLISVDNFTEPTPAAGVTVSQVTFTMRTTYDDWTNTPALHTAFPGPLGMAGTAQRTLPMQLTNNGWEVALDLAAGLQ